MSNRQPINVPNDSELMEQFISAFANEKELERRLESVRAPYSAAETRLLQCMQQLRDAISNQEPESGVLHAAHQALEVIAERRESKHGLQEAQERLDAAQRERQRIEDALLAD